MYAWISIGSMLTLMFVYIALVLWARSDGDVKRPASTRGDNSVWPAALITMAGAVASAPGAKAQNVVTHWAGVIQPAIHSPSAPRPPGSSEVLHATVQLAMYDAVVAIHGGYQPYAGTIASAPGADVRAAVATAAYRTARARVAASQHPYLDWHYADYMASVPAGSAKNDGVKVGEATAAAMLTQRQNDGFGNSVPYACSTQPIPYAEFEPNGGCGSQPVDAKLAQVVPFTFSNPAAFLPGAPVDFSSRKWVRDFNETKAYGRANSTVRTPEQTDVAYFWAEHTYVHWNRNLNQLAIARGLSVLETARMLALAHTAAADAVIAGFNTKYHYRFVRPRTAIPRAAEDGNEHTTPEADWLPLLSVNHPEYPSAHAFWTTALTDAMGHYFCGEDIAWTLTTSQDAVPQVVKPQRKFSNLNQIVRELNNARVWAGLHWRSSMKAGGKLGSDVARHVAHYFGQTCNSFTTTLESDPE